MTWSIERMFHPTLFVPDLDPAARFFRRVFGREPIFMADTANRRGNVTPSSYPTDYSFFVSMADVWFDTMDPSRYVIKGRQPLDSVEQPHLEQFGWFATGTAEVWSRLRQRGIACTDQLFDVIDSDTPPKAQYADVDLFFTEPADAGLRYEIYPASRISPLDPRGAQGWQLPPASPTDPLGIEKCAYHTVLTADARRALGIVVDTLGGSIILEEYNAMLDADSTYVAIADAVIEYARPRSAESACGRDLLDYGHPDSYYSLTWKVADLDRVATHLERVGVRIARQTDSLITTDPNTSLGVPWGFTSSLISGDFGELV